MTHKYTLTNEGLERLKAELTELINVERPTVLKEIEEARSYGDLSENADYDAARNKQGKIEGRIAQIEHIISNSHIVELTTTNEKVSIGNYVEVVDPNTEERFSFRIVGLFEGLPLEGTISIESPLAMAVLGKKVGDKALVKVQQPYEVEILNIALVPIV